jgi:CRISPR/Cas system-associated endonuclease Cas1
MQRIEVHFAAGQLSEQALNEVRKCGKMSEAVSWEEAAERLYWMIFEQPQ